MSQLIVVPVLDQLPTLLATALAQWTAGEIGLAGGIIFLAYTVFAIAGFGTALVAAPVLAQVMPVTQVIPLLAALDFIAALRSIHQPEGEVQRGELRRLLPFMLLGIAVGTYGLVTLPSQGLALGLGLFAAYQGLRGFISRGKGTPLAPHWGPVFGLSGGFLGAIFGSGGFLYAIYLGRRLRAPAAIRATQAVLISVSTLSRTIGFVAVGLFDRGGLWPLVVLCLPVMALGLGTGRYLGRRLSPDRFRQVINGLLLLSGGALLARVVLA